MQQKTIWISLAIITGFIAFSWAASFIYYFLASYIGNPPPWAVWQAAFNPISEKTGSQLVLAFGLPFVGLFLAIGSLFYIFKNNRFDYADAKWADLRELRKAKLLGNTGVLLGKLKGKYIFSGNDTHTIVSAKTRSGKGVGVIIPNLLLWNGSVVCLDIKHENFELTAGYRSKYSSGRVFKWDPLADEMRTHGFNPLDQISNDPLKRIVDIRRIAGILLPVEGKDKFWITEARSLFIGLALYVIDQPDDIMPSTIGSIYRLLSAEAELGDICRYVCKSQPNLNQAIIATMNRFANKAAKERSGVKSQLDSALELWQFPHIDAATSKSSFKIKELREKKMSVYICVTAGELDTVSSILKLFFEFFSTQMTMKLPDKETEPHEVLLVLDEMHMLGKMDRVKESFTISSGFGCRVLAAIQDVSSLEEIYGRPGRNTIISNCENQIYFRSKLLESARELSATLGNRVVEMVSYSQQDSFGYKPRTKNISHQEKPLKSASQIMQLDDEKGILISSNKNPVYFDKVRFHDDEAFKDRILPTPLIDPLPYKTIDIPKFDTKKLKELSAAKETDPNQTSIFDRDAFQENDKEFETQINSLDLKPHSAD